ncbi:two-component system histidine kinase DccS [Hydrogenimonas sp.]|nr:two-component system histidine kinase DccS [Hydrogenimonas sp.]
MRGVEREAFIKSFLLFFSSLSILLALLFFTIYKKELANLDSSLFSQMRICSFDLKCPKFKIDFEDSGSKELYTLKKSGSGLYSLFPIGGGSRYLLKIAYPRNSYEKDIAKIRKETLLEFFAVEFAVLLLSALFALYSINPLRQALKLTEEFVRDILHDFNTPLSIIRLNVRMLEKECPGSPKSTRIEDAVETLLRLQANLRAYLGGHEMQVESFRLDTLLEERAALIGRGYPSIEFITELEPLEVRCAKDAIIRIVDNVISNAAKYNVEGGRVFVKLDAEGKILRIEDNGVGIENPERVFERFYREHDRGVGIGLNIVKKLCDETGIGVKVESDKGVGTRFIFDLKKVTLS